MEQMPETCALDVAERGPNTLPEVAALLGVSRQRVSQVEIAALKKLRAALVETAGQAIEEMLPGLFVIPADGSQEVDGRGPWG